MSEPPVLVSVDERYWKVAAADLRRAIPHGFVSRLGPDLARVEGADLATVSAACTVGVPWAQHLTVADETVAVGGDVDRAARAAAGFARAVGADGAALQVWTSGEGPVKAESLRHAVTERFDADGIAHVRSGADHALTVVLVEGDLHLGHAPVALMRSDWPAGRMWLRKPEGQVSRAEFKLEELLKVGALDLTGVRTAVDLGGSPGGWTRILRQHDVEVWLVDPAPVDERVLADPGVHHVETTAGRFVEQSDRRFDLVVNDMRMPAKMSAGLTCDLADRLRPGALAVVTFKLTPESAAKTVAQGRRALERAFDVVEVRQLFHNRNEVTAVGRRRN